MRRSWRRRRSSSTARSTSASSTRRQHRDEPRRHRRIGDAFVTMHRADHTNGMQHRLRHEHRDASGFIISDKKPTQERRERRRSTMRATRSDVRDEGCHRTVSGTRRGRRPVRRPFHDGTDAGRRRRRLAERRPRIPDALRYVPAHRDRDARLRDRGQRTVRCRRSRP